MNFSIITRGDTIVRNTVFNLIGYIAPMAVAVWAVPVLLRQLGADRFGLLLLVWSITGYLSFFDLGAGRALTKIVAEKMALGEHAYIPVLVWTAMGIMAVVGLAGSALFLLLANPLVELLKVPRALHAEALGAFYLLSPAIPIITLTSGFRSLLEGQHRFRESNAVRLPLGVASFAAPVATAWLCRGLVPVVAVLIFIRLLALVAYVLICFRVTPELRKRPAFARSAIRQVLVLGSWITVNGAIGALLPTAERFLIGMLISSSAVAYYATPYEMLTKLWLLPLALSGVLFPMFSASHALKRQHASVLFDRSIRFTFIILFPVTLLCIAFAREGLTIWLGAPFADQSFRVAQWLSIGVFMLALEAVPFVLLQGVGRPDLPAKVNLAEIPFYGIALWTMVHAHGIVGAAMVWAARAAIDSLILFLLARRFLTRSDAPSARSSWTLALPVGMLFAAMAPASLPVRIGLVTTSLLFFLGFGWACILTPADRLALRGLMPVQAQ